MYDFIRVGRFMDDGTPIYSIEDIVSKTGGNTDECPFDCQCCY